MLFMYFCKLMNKIGSRKIYKGNVSAVVVIRLLAVLFVLSLSRMSLYVFNYRLFSSFSLGEILQAYFYGLRFDLSILFIISSLYILANALPFGFRRNTYYQKAINTISLIVISLAVIFNMIDAVYYRFTLKRMTYDIFHYVAANGGFLDVAPGFILNFWYITLTTVLLVVFLIYLFYRIELNRKVEMMGWRFYVRQSLLFILSMAIIIIGIRGGFQLKPINIVDASLHAPARLSAVVLNTPFTIVKSYGQTGFQEKDYFSAEELKEIYDPIRVFPIDKNRTENKLNVVVLILESFSSEHIGYLSHQKSFTPFLDSLFEHSLIFAATANGKRSIEGIPAVLSSIPTLTNESFLNGPYAANQIEGLAATLEKHQYHTAFFHGGKNGTMSFDAYAYSSGFQEYYGMNEYPDKADYDGHWGIWDEPYLQYFAHSLDNFPQPFLSTLFTLSSHHPYQVPERYKDMLPDGKLEIQKPIAYTDMALRNFFKTAKDKPWYAHTLFVLTADHTSEGAEAKYQNALGQFSIPIAFFMPSDSLLKYYPKKLPVQQLDIFPSIIDYLGLSDTILCFGSSVFDTTSSAFAINHYNSRIQMLNHNYLMQIQEDRVKALYDYRMDSLLQNNIVGKRDVTEVLNFQRAVIQQYNNRMIRNHLKAGGYE